MIDALSMTAIDYRKEPHESHDFGPKESTLVACASNDRFGQIRQCMNCGGREVWAGGPGSHYVDRELLSRCEERP